MFIFVMSNDKLTRYSTYRSHTFMELNNLLKFWEYRGMKVSIKLCTINLNVHDFHKKKITIWRYIASSNTSDDFFQHELMILIAQLFYSNTRTMTQTLYSAYSITLRPRISRIGLFWTQGGLSFKITRCVSLYQWLSICHGTSMIIYSYYRVHCYTINSTHRFIIVSVSANRPISQMRALLAACHELAVNYDTLPKLLYVLNIKRSKFHPMAHILALWYFDTSVTYPQWFSGIIVL